ncbi:hypothetical protein ACHQM5_006123 [Ranunculus cassubicifolius]
MVKSILIDEPQFKSTEDRLHNSSLQSDIGLIIGKINPNLDRAFIFDLIPTPSNDNGQPPSSLSSITKSSKSKSKSQSESLLLDTDWISEHANQVSQMLLGGVNVIGIYIWSPESSFSSSNASIFQVIKGVADATPARGTSNDYIIVHFCYSPRKLVVRSCVPGSSSLRICEFKLGRVLSSLRRFKCLYNFEMQLPITKGGGSFRDVVNNAITRHGKELNGAKALVDGDIVFDDRLESVEGLHNVEMLLPVMRDCVGETKDEVIGVVVFRGFVCSYAYLNPKESVEQAISDIKRDIIMSLQSRLNIMCDEVEEDVGSGENTEEVSGERSITQIELQLLKKPTRLAFPRRVLVPWIGDVFICDYLQPSDTFGVVQDHCKELLSWEVPADSSLILEPEKEAISLATKTFWDVVVPKNLPSASDSNSMVTRGNDTMQMEGNKASVLSANLNTIFAIAILILAIVIGFLFYRL